MNFNLFTNSLFTILFLSLLTSIASLAMDQRDMDTILHKGLMAKHAFKAKDKYNPNAKRKKPKNLLHHCLFLTPYQQPDVVDYKIEKSAPDCVVTSQPELYSAPQLIIINNYNQFNLCTEEHRRHKEQLPQDEPSPKQQEAQKFLPFKQAELIDLAKYARSHDGIRSFKLRDYQGNEIKNNKGQKQYFCPVKDCNNTTSRSSDFTKHFRNVHLKNAGLMYHCDEMHCLFGFANAQGLLDHIENHHKDETMRDLDNHTQYFLSHDEPPFKRAKYDH